MKRELLNVVDWNWTVKHSVVQLQARLGLGVIEMMVRWWQINGSNNSGKITLEILEETGRKMVCFPVSCGLQLHAKHHSKKQRVIQSKSHSHKIGGHRMTGCLSIITQ